MGQTPRGHVGSCLTTCVMTRLGTGLTSGLTKPRDLGRVQWRVGDNTWKVHLPSDGDSQQPRPSVSLNTHFVAPNTIKAARIFRSKDKAFKA